MTAPRLLVLSHVLPFPGSAGQEQRVRETLAAARPTFHVTFATSAPAQEHAALRTKLAPYCDDVILLPSTFHRSLAHRAFHHATGAAYALATGLKSSNYIIGRLEFAPGRVASLLRGRRFDVALFEYWHAAASTRVLQEHGVRCVLDMHDILWKGREQRLRERTVIPAALRDASVARYKRAEEHAWTLFDGVVAINEEERDHVRTHVATHVPVFYAPMGTDLDKWCYRWSPATPPRLAYYGGLGTSHNQRSAVQCYRDIMPLVWKAHPDAELWLVGSNPPEELRGLAAADARVTVTGFVPDPRATLASMTAVLCPWRGTYGFRSRLVEVMGLGVPVVASPDAVAGMGMTVGNGLFLAEEATEFAGAASRLIREPEFARRQSRLAREQTERSFSLDNTYGRLMRELAGWLVQATP
jgi:glycosyltransferase involved in cell wall biosynthesis